MSLHSISDNPYIFTVTGPDSQAVPGLQFEDEVKREQRRTIFDADPTAQKLFRGNFDLYYQAVENPDRFITLLRSAAQERPHERPSSPPPHPHREWEEGREGEWDEEEMEDAFHEMIGAEDAQEETDIDEEIFLQAEDWAVIHHRWSHTLYFNRKMKHRDLFRVHENAFAVSDLVYESCRIMKEEPGMPPLMATELSVIPLRIARIFLERCIESLRALRIARIGAEATLARNLTLSMELLKNLERALTEKEEFLKSSGRWEYFQKGGQQI